MEDRDVYVPSYSRELHEPVAAAHRVPATAKLVISEGNYLLLDEEPWRGVAEFFDEVWFVVIGRGIARRRLIARQLAGGRSRAAAEDWVERNDMANTDIVNRTAAAAHVLIDLPDGSFPAQA